jgi:hypothetical protein
VFIFNKKSILHTFSIFIIMRPRKKEDDKRIKISITLTPLINKKMEIDLINKSKLIEKLLTEYYDKKDLYKM